MADVFEATKGKIRDLPISGELRALLLQAAELSGVETVKVTSGGQCRKGTCARRTGSERHDAGQAADLELLVGGESLAFTDQLGVEYFKTFVIEAARAGATGIGGGSAYMGEKTIHIGFGKGAVWGAGGRSANAPAWLVAAAKQGWGFPKGMVPDEGLDSPDEEEETDYR